MPTSGNVDERIVEMRIDHDKFEQGAKKTIDILEKLDEGLKSLGKKQTDGFDDVASSLDKVTNKISVFGTIGDQIIRNLTSQAMDLVRQFNHMVDSLTIDQVSAGWSKYAQKTQGVQTIMAATAKDWEDQGAQMEYVNAQLDKLNWFTDETSYNLLDMVNNIGKFTSAGVDLETAVTAMQGIATWAGISGANTQEASRAMYNLSQALGVGAVTQMDWKSIENANMATYEFKQIVLETAAAMGKLEKVKDGVFKTDYTNKSGEIHEVTVESFRQYLSDKWFDSDVLMAALEQYGGFTDLLYEVSDATKLTATQILQQIKLYEEDKKVISKLEPYIKDLASAEYELGRRAFRAAQEAKTFQEAIDATKDAVSTAWMNVFETIFGDYLKAKELWTSVAESLYTIFADPVNRLWEIFDQAFNGPNPLRDSLAEAGYTMGELEEAAKSTIEELSSSKDYNDVFRADALQKLIDKYGSLEGAIKAGAVSASMFSMILDQMNRNTIDDILLGKNTHFNDVLTDLRQNAMWFMNGAIDEQTLIARGYNMDMIKYWVAAYEKAKKSGKEDDDITPYTDEFMEKFYDDLLKLAGYTDEEIEAFKELGLTVNQVLESMTDPMVTRTEGFKLFADSLLNLLTVVENIGNAISSAFSVIFGGGTGEGADEIANSNAAEGLYQLIERFHNFTESLVLTEDEMNTLRDRFVSFFESISSVRGIFDIIGAVLSGIWNIVLKIFGAISDSKLLPTLLNAALILLQALAIPLGLIVSGISALINKGQELSKQEWAQRLTGWFTQLGTKILDAANRFKTFMESSEVAAWLTSTLDEIISFLSPLADGFSNAIKKIQYFWKVLKQVFKLSGFSGVLKWLGANISAKLSLIFEDLKKKFSKENIKATFNSIITSISNFFTSNTSLGAIGTAIKTFFSNIFEKIYTFISNKIDISKLSPAWESIKNFFIGIFNSVSSFLTGKFNFKGFGDAFTSIWEFIKNIASKVKNFVSGKLSFENIGDTLRSFVKFLSDLVREAMPLIRTGLVIYVLTSIFQWQRALRWLVETPSEVAESFKIGGIASLIGSVALLVVALAGAVKLLSTIPFTDMMNALIGLGLASLILISAVGLISLINMIPGGINTKALWSIVPVAIGIGIIAGVLAVLGKMKFEQLVQGWVALSALLVEIMVFSVVYGIMARIAKGGFKDILYVAAGMWILADTLKKLGSMKITEMLKGWLGLRLIIGQIIRFTRRRGAMANMKDIIYVALSIMIIAKTMKGLASLSIGEMIKGWIGLRLIIGQIIRFTRRTEGKTASKNLSGLMAVAVSVLILVGAMKALATMSVGEIFKAWIALFLLIGQLTKIMRATVIKTGFGKSAKVWTRDMSGLGALIAVALAVAGLAAVMIALGKVPAKQLLKGFAAIAGIMTGLSILMRSAKGVFGAKAVRSIAAALGIIGIIVASAYVLKKLSDIPGKRLAAAAGSLSLVLIAIAGAMTILNRFSGAFNPGAIGLLIVGIGALWAVAEVLTPLGESNLDWKRIGEVALVLIGTLVGIAGAALLLSKLPAGAAITGIKNAGLIFAAIEIVILLLIAIGLLVVEAAIALAGKLAIFVEKLQPFLNTIKSWDASTVENVQRFAEVMGLLMLAEIFTAVASALAKVPSADLFADLSTLGKKVKEFATDISTLTEDDITRIGTFNNVMAAIAGITAFEALGQFFSWVASWFDEEKEIESIDIGGEDGATVHVIEKVNRMFERINALAIAITGENGFLAQLGVIDPKDVEKVQNFANVMKAFAGVEGWAFVGEMLNTLGNITAKVGNKAGIGDNFVTNIVALYEAVRKVVDGLRGVDEKGNYNDEKAIGSNALIKIKKFTNIIQEIAKITGWTALGKMLTAIGNKSGISVVTLKTNLNNLVIVARSFADTIKDQNIGGGTTEKIKNFADIMNAIGKITAWHNISRMMTYLGNKFGDAYSVELNALPQTIASFATAIQDANIPTDGGVIDQVKAFANIMKEIARITGWATFSDIIAHLSPANNTSGDAKNAMEMLRDFTAALPDFITNISGLDGSESDKIEKFTNCIGKIVSAKIWTTSWAVATTDEAEKATELIDVLDVFNDHFVPFFQRFNSDLSMVDVLNVQRAFEILDNIGKNNILNNLVNQLQSFWIDLTLIDFSENGGIDLKTMAELLNGTASIISEILNLHELLTSSDDSSSAISGALASVLGSLSMDPTVSANSESVGAHIISVIASGIKSDTAGALYSAGIRVIELLDTGVVDGDFNRIATSISNGLGTITSDGNIMAKAWTVGFNVVSGIAAGVADNLLAAYNAGVSAANETIRGFTDAADINSPSRVFAALAEYIPAGIAKGIENNTGEAVDSMTILSSAVLAAMQMAMANVATIADSDFDISPRITPVVDMSNVEFAAGNTGRMFGSVGTAVRGSMRLAMDTMQASNNPRDNGSGNIVNEIRTMSAKLDGLESAVRSMQIVLDTGELVGSTYKKMDGALGTAQARKSRAN